MARHAKTSGALIVGPWRTASARRLATSNLHAGEIGADKVCRMTVSSQEGNVSVMQMHYLRSTAGSIEHYNERLELGLFTREEMAHAFEAAKMDVRHDSEGLMGRGLYIARPRS